MLELILRKYLVKRRNKMKKYVIDIKQGEFYNAGFKAKIDVDNILNENGFETLFLKVNQANNMIDRIKNSFSAYKQLKKLLKEVENN